MHRLYRKEGSSDDDIKVGSPGVPVAELFDHSYNFLLQVSVDRLAEIRVGDLVTHPACLVSIHLTQLSLDAGDRSSLIPRLVFRMKAFGFRRFVVLSWCGHGVD